ncbi:uncharacterized protein DUF2029 [Jatrophihabitans sp. GAS493]|uniref:glycosyltransferase family 87 protein n=1 Tax=Jatrophihabitans sp. GAS493 TaxID=1907575 RepID=UPI000BB8A6DA|nr:glycosyltransferase family 87 protein [Jatrophihabitans sp. GAS493]SOD71928.1 uncharacterized protein DUF2029 [Jatrophihabitans sp. GAS493]
MATTALNGSSPPVPGSRTLRRLGIPPLPVELTDPDSGRALALAWIATRAFVVTFLVWIEGVVAGDVAYYARSLQSMFDGGGVRETLQEYPLPVLGILVPQFAAGWLNPTAFALVFVGSMLAVDAALTRLFWVASRRTRGPAVTFWLWFLPAIGPMAYFRFDLLPAAFAAGVVLTAVRRPAIAGMFTAFGAALKLWPAIMLPILLVRRAGQRQVLTSFLATGAAIAAICLLIGGVGRSISPLSWQDARGLQIESVPAVPLMLLRGVHPHGIWQVHPSKYKSAEIFGPAVSTVLTLTTVATIAALIFLGILVVRARTMKEVSAQTMGWLLLAAAMLITVTNKTLSPQYLVWLGGPLAALLIFRRAAHESGGVAQQAARWLMAAAVITHVIYPVKYSKLMNISEQTFWVTLLLAARNIILLYITWLVCKEAWSHTSHSNEAQQASEAELAAETADAASAPAARTSE